MSDKPLMRVALVGYAFMGAAHSQAWRNAHRFFDLPAVPELAVLCGRNSLAFDFERLNELQVYDGMAPAADAGFRRILATEPDHPYAGAWWPPGHGLGYEHTFVHEVADFVRDVRAGTPPAPSFADGLYVQRVLDAVERSSAASSTWTEIG